MERREEVQSEACFRMARIIEVLYKPGARISLRTDPGEHRVHVRANDDGLISLFSILAAVGIGPPEGPESVTFEPGPHITTPGAGMVLRVERKEGPSRAMFSGEGPGVANPTLTLGGDAILKLAISILEFVEKSVPGSSMEVSRKNHFSPDSMFDLTIERE